MYIRLSFENYQRVHKDRIEDIRKVLGDDVHFTECIAVESGKYETFSSWSHTLDPNDPKLADGKVRLVFRSDYVQLDTGKEYFCDFDLWVQRFPDIKISLRGMPPTIENNFSSVLESLKQIQDKFEDTIQRFDKQVTFNEQVQVHVGGFALMNVNEVILAEDCCTDKLQEQLAKGYRLLAVCVQKDQRRPDYILGRYNADADIFTTKAGRV